MALIISPFTPEEFMDIVFGALCAIWAQLCIIIYQLDKLRKHE
jgi:hypothetical protein